MSLDSAQQDSQDKMPLRQNAAAKTLPNYSVQPLEKKWRAGVLGATGLVGQRIVKLLSNHPWFELTEVAASERSSGKRYFEAARWHLDGPIPENTRDLIVKGLEPTLECDFVFSALDSSVAGGAEEDFARAGYPVVSNSRNHRMDAYVPLLIPEVNAAHLEAIPIQQKKCGYDRGFIVTNPNCSTAGLVLVLKPLADAFGLEKVFVVTLQAVSGAGYPGVATMDIQGNVIPFISGEEEKMESEPQKLLGKWDGSRFVDAGVGLTAHCNRVQVLDGHLECVSIGLKKIASLREVQEALRTFEIDAELAALPSALRHPIIVLDEENRPQPRRDVDAGGWHGCRRRARAGMPATRCETHFAFAQSGSWRGRGGGDECRVVSCSWLF